MALELLVVTVREIFQSEAQEMGRFGQDYSQKSTVILLDKGDIKSLGVKEGDRVKVESDSGQVVVTVHQDQEAHPGLAFMPNSPWANQLVSSQETESRIPEYKRIKVRASPSQEEVTPLSRILEKMRE
jgi:formylmethanofuran dehydrogenase subunit D